MDISKFFQKIMNKTGKDKILIIILIGILMMVIALPTTKDNKNNVEKNYQEKKKEVNTDYSTQLENKLKNALEKVDGVGKCNCVITFKNTGEKILAKDNQILNKEESEKEVNGNESYIKEYSYDEVHIFYEGENGNEPYILSENTPSIEGVLVVCEGGGNQQVIANVTNIVESLLGVPIHKISVMKMS